MIGSPFDSDSPLPPIPSVPPGSSRRCRSRGSRKVCTEYAVR